MFGGHAIVHEKKQAGATKSLRRAGQASSAPTKEQHQTATGAAA